MQTQQNNPQNNPSSSWIGKATFLAALLVASALVAVPFLATVLLSFKDYVYPQGILSSPFTGLSNYRALFQTPEFGQAVAHSLAFSVLSAATLMVAGALAGFCLRAIPVGWVRHGLCTLLLVPLLTPGELWAQAFYSLFPAQSSQSLVLVALWCGLKYVGLPVLLATAALARSNHAPAAPVLSAAVAALGLFALLGLQDNAFIRMMPTLSTMRDSLDTFVYRPMMEQARFSVSACVELVALALRAVLLAAVAWPVTALVKRLFPKNAADNPTTPQDRVLSLLAATVLTLAAAGGLALAARGLPLQPLAGTLTVYPVYILLALVGAAVNTALCLCLARPVVTAPPAQRRWATVVLLALTALGASPILLGGYQLTRGLGMANTFYPVLFNGIGSVLGVWPLVFAARAMGVTDNAQWLRRMWRPSLALLAVGTILRMNDTMPNMLYIQQTNLMHPLQALTTIQAHAEFLGHSVPVGAIGAFAALVTMVLPVVLLLLVRTLLTEQQTVGLGLPTK